MGQTDQGTIWQAILSNDPENIWKAVYSTKSDRYNSVIDKVPGRTNVSMLYRTTDLSIQDVNLGRKKNSRLPKSVLNRDLREKNTQFKHLRI